MSKTASKYSFKPRHPVLKGMEQDYGLFELSCRHKDMLRCSKTKHFSSCYSPKGINKHVPYFLCTIPSFAIIGKKDTSGDFIWRSFVQYRKEVFTPMIWVYKMYGNPPVAVDIRKEIRDCLMMYVDKVVFLYEDAW